MTYTVFSKDRKSLQFPVMCDGYITIPRFEANTPNQEIGLWGHSGGFSFEAVLTPYDVNGNPDGFSATQKSLSRGTKGDAYILGGNRKDVKMRVFHNDNFFIELVNTESETSPSTPAKYSIRVTLKIGSTTTTLESSTVINPTDIDDSSLSPTDYLYSNHGAFAKKSSRTVLSSNDSATNNTITLSGAPEFGVGYTLYRDNGTLIGGINQVSSSTVTLIGQALTTDNTPANGSHIYYSLPKEPLYVNTPHHIAFNYTADGLMQIFYNGELVGSGTHGAGGNFSFDATDCYIGQNKNGSSFTVRRLSQFMGEIHELSIMGISKTQFKSTNTLYPLFKETLLYMDFEEANLSG